MVLDLNTTVNTANKQTHEARPILPPSPSTHDPFRWQFYRSLVEGSKHNLLQHIPREPNEGESVAHSGVPAGLKRRKGSSSPDPL